MDEDLVPAGTVARPTTILKPPHFVGSAIYPPLVGCADQEGVV